MSPPNIQLFKQFFRCKKIDSKSLEVFFVSGNNRFTFALHGVNGQKAIFKILPPFLEGRIHITICNRQDSDNVQNVPKRINVLILIDIIR